MGEFFTVQVVAMPKLILMLRAARKSLLLKLCPQQ